MSVFCCDVSTSSISLDKSSCFFTDGDIVTGKVVAALNDLRDCKELRIEANGISSVVLNKQANSNLSTIDKFFKWSKILDLGNILGDSNNFEFKFYLPNDVPSSCEGTYGHIFYEMVLTAKTEKELKILASTPFTVSAGIDLSYVPEAAAKIDICKYKESGWCCFEDMTTARWMVDFSGYLPNDIVTIRTFAEEDNSQHSIRLRDTVFFKIISYKVDKKKKTERVEIAKASTGMMLKKDGNIERIEFLTIPQVPCTGFSRNKFIDIYYELEFRAEIINGTSKELVATAEIYIGSVPIDLERMKLHVATAFNQRHLLVPRPNSQPIAPSAPSLSFYDFCPSVDEVGQIEEIHTPPPSYATAIGARN